MGAYERVAAALADPHTPRLVVQPIVDLARGVVAGYEALARFDIEPHLPPDAWFALAHRVGLGPALEAKAVARALTLRCQLPPETFLTVNVSVTTLAGSGLDELMVEVADWSRVIVEVTEHSLGLDSASAQRAVTRLRRRGAMLALDDTGAGYSNLREILQLRPELIKLDRFLVRGIERDPAKRALAQMLGEFAGRIDAWLLAEGIETAAELDTVCRLGVPLGQGWALGHPGEPWPALAPQAASLVRQHPAIGAPAGTVAAALEPAATATDTVTGHHRLHVDRTLPGVVIVDDRRRPSWLLARGAGDVPAQLTRPVVLDPTTPIVDALRRALTRPEPARDLPLLCTDEQGLLLGWTPVAALVAALVDLDGVGAGPEASFEPSRLVSAAPASAPPAYRPPRRGLPAVDLLRGAYEVFPLR